MEQLFIQGGALGVVAWLVFQFNRAWQENNKEWRAHLAERNSKLEKALDKLADAIANK
jgi:hypothetical protein